VFLLSRIIIASSNFITKTLFHFTLILRDSLLKEWFPFLSLSLLIQNLSPKHFFILPPLWVILFVRVVFLSMVINANFHFVTKTIFHFTPILFTPFLGILFWLDYRIFRFKSPKIYKSILRCSNLPFYGYKCKFSLCDQNNFSFYPHLRCMVYD
jgi:hypothetical protein